MSVCGKSQAGRKYGQEYRFPASLPAAAWPWSRQESRKGARHPKTDSSQLKLYVQGSS